MQKILRMLPYLLICELTFLIMINFVEDTGGFIFLLFIIIPIVCFVVSIIYGWLNGFYSMQLMLPLFIGVLFTLTFYIVYQEIAWIYTAAYTAISLVGNEIGFLTKKFIYRKK